jgi:hypothetical protein
VGDGDGLDAVAGEFDEAGVDEAERASGDGDAGADEPGLVVIEEAGVLAWAAPGVGGLAQDDLGDGLAVGVCDRDEGGAGGEVVGVAICVIRPLDGEAIVEFGFGGFGFDGAEFGEGGDELADAVGLGREVGLAREQPAVVLAVGVAGEDDGVGVA